MLYQYMHSHYLVVESKEDDDGSKARNKMLGERQRLKIPGKLKPGVYYVRDTSENQRYEVTVRCKYFDDRDRSSPSEEFRASSDS